MDTKRYIISDAAKMVDVEAHVLRYWEDELELPIARNEMGHRYYTEDNIQMFHRIKDLKEQGYHYLLGTAHPDNVASVNTFLKLQYEQVMTKEKYGGMKRSIFCKAI